MVLIHCELKDCGTVVKLETCFQEVWLAQVQGSGDS